MVASQDNHDQDLQLAVEFITTHLPLTPRQAEVLHWIAEGKTNDEIATILACSFHTVKTHLKQIFQRLGVHTRTGAAAVAYRALIQRQLQATASPERAIPLQKKSG
jgi:DNA-binding CsgD family transcriptional regulator